MIQRAGQLARETPVARADDPLGLVAENLRESRYDAIPVVEGDLDDEGRLGPGARIVGVIFEPDLARAVLPSLVHREAVRVGANGANSLESIRPSDGSTAGGHPQFDLNLNGHAHLAEEVRDFDSLAARDVMHNAGFVPTHFSLHNTLLTLDRYDAPALPVVNESGHYRGMIGRADVIAALGNQVRPPVVGGMATPLGVWLTTGTLSAGAPPLGLFLSGATMGLCYALSHYILLFALAAMNAQWGAMFLSGRLGIESTSSNLFNIAVTAVEGLLFLTIMRLMPLSGVHAAEHQTVHAIERGVPLEAEWVRKMPRAHPRCGTNLVALGGLILIVFGHLPSTSPGTVLFALLLIYLAWRRLGTDLQNLFTTRPASDKQLESGIRAGKELLRKYQDEPHLLTSFGARLFNSGLLLSAAGMILVTSAFSYLASELATRWLAGR